MVYEPNLLDDGVCYQNLIVFQHPMHEDRILQKQCCTIGSVGKPLIADLNGNGSDQAQASCRIGKDADDPGAALKFAIDSLKAIGSANQPSVQFGESEDGQPFRQAAFQPVGELESGFNVLVHRFAQERLGFMAVGRIEDGADVSRHFAFHLLFWHILAGVLLEMELVSICGRDRATTLRPSYTAKGREREASNGVDLRPSRAA